jgi:transcriptional regulator with XRE-family HTH domain
MSNEKTPIDRLKERLPLDRPVQTSFRVESGSHERFSEVELARIKREFANRMRQAFDHDNNAAIARRCKTTDATIKLYMDAERLPNPEMLLQIARVTGVNLHWLLTGQGARRVEFGNLFSEEEEEKLTKLAKQNGLTFNELVRKLVLAGADFLDSFK